MPLSKPNPPKEKTVSLRCADCKRFVQVRVYEDGRIKGDGLLFCPHCRGALG
jgi:DNA-directed RNA polymerase subunit RPC12/RpoP